MKVKEERGDPRNRIGMEWNRMEKEKEERRPCGTGLERTDRNGRYCTGKELEGLPLLWTPEGRGSKRGWKVFTSSGHQRGGGGKSYHLRPAEHVRKAEEESCD